MAKTRRNDLCPCGSGRKYKKCCEPADRSGVSGRVLLLLVGGAVLAALIVGITSFTGQTTSSSSPVWSSEHGHYHDANGTAVP